MSLVTLELDFSWEGEGTREGLDLVLDPFCQRWRVSANVVQLHGPAGGAAVIDFTGEVPDMIRMLLHPDGYGLDFEDCVWYLSGFDDSIYEVGVRARA